MAVSKKSSPKKEDMKQSSKLSFGSSTSLSAEEQLEGDGPLTPTDKIEESDDDDLSALNSILQAGSPGSLSEEEVDPHDSASSLSSGPDDFPLSRSASPEMEELSQEEADEEEEGGGGGNKEQIQLRKQRKTHYNNKKSDENSEYQRRRSLKRSILEDPKSLEEDQKELGHRRPSDSSSTSEELKGTNKRRRLSKPVLDTERSRRRPSRQEDKNGSSKESTDKIEEETTVDTKDDSSHDTKEMELDEEKPKGQDEDKIVKEVDPLIQKSNHSNEKQTTLDKTITNTEEENIDNEEENETHDGNDQDYQRRHKEALDALTQIEIEFARLRDKMYQEKMSELNEEAIMIANGTHPELVSLMAEIKGKKERRINSAEAWRRHQHANFKQQFEGFEYQANIHFVSQKNALRRNLLSTLNTNKWTIEDERSKLNDTRDTRIFPDERELVLHKKEQKEETNELQDIKEIAGFPMALNPSGLSIQDIDDDLKLLGIHTNITNSNPHYV